MNAPRDDRQAAHGAAREGAAPPAPLVQQGFSPVSEQA